MKSVYLIPGKAFSTNTRSTFLFYTVTSDWQIFILFFTSCSAVLSFFFFFLYLEKTNVANLRLWIYWRNLVTKENLFKCVFFKSILRFLPWCWHPFTCLLDVPQLALKAPLCLLLCSEWGKLQHFLGYREPYFQKYASLSKRYSFWMLCCEASKLPVYPYTVLKSVLNVLIKTKLTANPSLASWSLKDLLGFICNANHEVNQSWGFLSMCPV